MRLKLDARARRILRRMPVVNVYSLAELALMAALAVQCARFVWVLTTPVTPLGDWRPAAPVAAGADILGSFDPFFRLGGGAAQPVTVTALQLTLFGTRIDEAMGGGSAIIAGPDGVQQSVAVGAEIQPGVRLKSVAFDHVTIERGGSDEDLFLDQSGAVAPVTPGAAPAAAAAGATPAAGVQVAQLRQDIGFIPRIDGGRLSGLTVRSQGTGAAFRAAGLKDGDVITSLGGRPVTGPGDLDRIGKDFAGGGNVPITVERGQDTLTLAITIAPPQ